MRFPLRVLIESERDRRLLVIATLVLILALTVRVSLSIEARTRSLHDRAAAQAQLLAADRALLAAADDLALQATAARETLTRAREGTFQAEDPRVAALQATEYLTSVLEATGLTIEPMPSFEVGREGALESSFHGIAEYGAALLLLHRLESGPMRILVHRASIDSDDSNAAGEVSIDLRLGAEWRPLR